MLAVKERLSQIQKLRRLLGLKYRRSIEIRINELLMENISEIRSIVSQPGFEILRDVLEQTALSSDQYIITNALSSDRELVAYHKALGSICRKALEVFDTDKLRAAYDEMSERNERLGENNEGVPKQSMGLHSLGLTRSLENARTE